ncbi:MAG: putative metal-binding motif-containing protein [Bacteroidales bacterium]|nr:putative metal-binding motif-containing protein [Bacteroidales bacterium]
MNRKILIFSTFLLLEFFVYANVSAQIPQLINYQARLTAVATGLPVEDGDYTVTFSIYNAATGGIALWTETQTINVTGGIYSVLLGSTNPVEASLFTAAERYLGVAVGEDPEMIPRKQIVSVPYVLQAKTAETISGTISETDPVFSASQAATITASDIANLSNISGTNNGDQTLSIDNHILTITGANNVQIPDSANDADADPLNEIQTLSLDGNMLILSKNESSVHLLGILTGGTYYYADKDGDGFGDRFAPGYVPPGSDVPAGFVQDKTDCNDEDENINPSATEIPGDGVDNDCDGEIDETD